MKSVVNFILNTYIGAVVAGSAFGLVVAGSIILAVMNNANASQVKTLPLEDTDIVSGVRICTYNNGGEVETVERKPYQKCPAVITVDVE